MESHKVVIIGAGIAGLHSAFKLSEFGINDVIILEALDRIGGRVNTVPMHGNWVELGAQWIHGRGDNPLWKFVQEHQIEVSPVASRDGEGIFVRDDGRVIPKEIMDETEQFLDKVHDRCYKYANMDPKLTPKSVGHYFEEEFEEWLRTKKADDDPETRKWRQQYFTWWIKWEECDCGCDDLYKHSVISWCEYVDHEPDTTFARGFSSLMKIYLRAFQKNNIRIHLNTIVDQIQWKGNNNSGVTIRCKDGTKFLARHVIWTGSLGYLKKHHNTLFEPSLPTKNVTAIQSIMFGTIDKILFEFEEPFWDNNNPGFMFMWDGDEEFGNHKEDPKNWIRSVIGLDAVLNQPNMLMAWISGESARFMETLSNDEISRTILNHLQKVVRKLKNDPAFQLPKVKQFMVTRWDSDPFFNGVFSYRNHESDLNGITNADLSSPLLSRGELRVLFAGEATDQSYYGTVHGAMNSADREVKRLIKSTSIT